MTVKPIRAALYLRVSTDDQTVALQRRDLLQAAEARGWQVVEVYTDEGISGSKGRDKRPGLDRMLKATEKRKHDVIMAWSVDRLGRSLQGLIGTLATVNDASVNLYLHQQQVDTTSASGRAMFQMMGVFAEFERAMIRERVMSGLAVAKAKGKTLGRPKIRGEKDFQIREHLAKGVGMVRCARLVGVGVSAVQRIKAEMGEALPT